MVFSRVGPNQSIEWGQIRISKSTPENLELLADIYMRQGLFDHAKALYLRVVKMGLK
jgi:hypothetical protein